MPFADEISAAAQKKIGFQPGGYYGSADGLSPGAGVIFQNVRFPLFNAGEGRFQLRSGNVLILTHECDIDKENERNFNEEVLVAPLMACTSFAVVFDVDKATRDRGINLATAIGANDVSRLIYLPPHVDDLAPGAFIHFNTITGTHVSQLSANGAKPICSLSEYGMGVIDTRLRNHLFRPKAESLPVLR